MKIKQLTPELLDDILADMNIPKKNTTDKPQILTSDYVSQFNHNVARRIQRHNLAHDVSIDLAKHTHIR